MRRNHQIAVFVIAVATLMGCTADRHVRLGDAARMSDKPELALNHYHQALRAAPKLTKNPLFIKKLKHSQARVAYAEALRLAEQGAWKQAIEQYRQALNADPRYEQAHRGLADAQRQASQMALERAIEFSDQGKLDDAVEQLERALELDSENDRASEALDTVQKRNHQQKSKADALYIESIVLIRDRRWRQAIDEFARIVHLNPLHIRARVARYEAMQKIDESASAQRRGASLLASKHLDKAIHSLQNAVDVWPYNQVAKGQLSSAQDRRAQALDHVRRANSLLHTAQWDKALEAAAEGRKIFPSHEHIGALVQTIKRDAASAWLQRGRDLLTTKDFDAAEAAYVRTLDYRPHHEDAHTGLADVDLARGQIAQKGNRWGRALLHYMDAADHHVARSRRHINAARDQLNKRIQLDLSITVEDATGQSTKTSRTLASTIQAQLLKRKPTYLDLATKERPDYRAVVTLHHLEVRTDLVDTEHRTHTYTDYRRVENPRIHELRSALHAAEDHVVHLQRRYDRKCRGCGGVGTLICTVCRGSRSIQCGGCHGRRIIVIKIASKPCRSCRGRWHAIKRCTHCGGRSHTVSRVTLKEKGDEKRKGKRRIERKRIPCGHCGGRGKWKIACPRHEPVAARHVRKNCDRCSGRGVIVCGTCHHRGRITCHHCGGSGRHLASIRSRLRSSEREVKRLRYQLACEPATVQEHFSASWPYILRRYCKKGVLAIGLTIHRIGTDAEIGSDTIEERVVREDSSIEHANPAIGLHADAKDLPSDTQVHHSLVESTSSPAVSKIISMIAKTESAHWQSKAGQFAAKGDQSESIEAQVAAALLLEPVDPASTRRRLLALRSP